MLSPCGLPCLSLDEEAALGEEVGQREEQDTDLTTVPDFLELLRYFAVTWINKSLL
jgi:hypothetical protein